MPEHAHSALSHGKHSYVSNYITIVLQMCFDGSQKGIQSVIGMGGRMNTHNVYIPKKRRKFAKVVVFGDSSHYYNWEHNAHTPQMIQGGKYQM